MSGAIPVLSRVEQHRHYGIDCGDAIHFEAGAWLPGGEHVKKITVKNVSTRTIKFKYELPTTKYFSMDFPTLITLSPGMQTVLDVAFRPLKVEEYDDSVTFHVQIIDGGVTATSGRFRLPVLARIARLALEIPRGLDFGFCPTAETTKLQFVLRNTGQIDSVYDWSLPGAGDHGRPFAIHPSSGRVAVGESVELVASFSPTIASVYVTTTVCSVRPASMAATSVEEETMKLSGISKFTHIAASETELHFGEILVGAATSARAPTEKEFVLRNRSLVRASFRVQRVESDGEPVFAFTPTSGVVAPESSVTVRVKYTPTSAGSFTCDHFDILTPGGNRERVTCKGKAIGPRLSLWKKSPDSNFVQTRSLNFGDVRVGESVSRVLTLRNESPQVDVLFHFDCQPTGVFAFDRVTGKVPPRLDLNVTLTFTPLRAGNFYRRFFVLLQHQSALFVDVLGTAFDESVRPSPFQQAHVDAYRLRAAAGLALLSPDQLESYWQEHGDDLFRKGALARMNSSSTSAQTDVLERTQLLTRSGEASLSDVDACHEFFVSVESRGNAVVVHSAFLDFGNCSITQFPSKKVLHVTNNTHGKVTCAWRVAMANSDGSSSTTSGSQHATFQMFPESLDISAGATAEFRVAFQPSVVNAYYFGELEGFASFKSNRTFRLVNVETFTPPWALVTKVCGNTFASPTDQFLPKLSFRVVRARSVVFPPCFLGDCVFQTIQLENASDTPALFAFVDDASQIFTCKPPRGYVAAKGFHLVQIRFAPRKARSYTHALQCIVNNAISMPETLELAGVCALPALTFHDEGSGGHSSADSNANSNNKEAARMFIKPTAVGLQSERGIVVSNASRVPLVFRWEIPRKLQDVFDVSPKLGRLNGRESALVMCCFTPPEVRAYASRFVVSVKSISVPWTTSHDQRFTIIPVLQEAIVRVQTKGTVGAVAFEPETTQFETILVNTSAKKTVWIVNSADCELQFALSQTLHVDSRSGTDQQSDQTTDTAVPARLAYSETRGRIPARSRKQIAVTFLPRVAGVFAFDVSCHTSVQATTSDRRHEQHPQQHVQRCRIHAEASFPTIVIDDIRVPHVPTTLAWQQFLCQEINEYMSTPPATSASDGVASARPESHSNGGDDEGDGDIVGDAKHVAVAFSPAPLGAAPQQVFLKLRNPGNLVVDFALRYPKEGNVEIEHWAETGAPSSDELRTNAIIDSKVFQIHPRRATLMPQRSITLCVSYAFVSDAYGGIHDLPILLQVDKGKRLVLELQGRTLPRSEPKLFLSRRVFTLSPVMIGEYRRAFPRGLSHSHGSNQDDGDDGDTVKWRQPPLQQLEVFNRGDTAFRLDVSSNAFAKINQHEYEAPRHGGSSDSGTFYHPVLRCVTSSEIVAAHSSVFVELQFAPIEAKTVEANLILKAHGLMGRAYKEVAMVTVIATGFHPLHTTLAALRRELALVSGVGAPPLSQRLTVPGQSVRLVSDRVAFNHIPTHAQTTELVVLTHTGTGADTSTSTGGAVQFEWDTSHPLVSSGVVSFSPARGELLRGHEALVRITITTTDVALVVDHDVACRIIAKDDEQLSLSTTKVSSPTKADRSSKSGVGIKPKPRPSVITRSTASQEAAVDRSVSVRGTNTSVAATGIPMGECASYPVFVHIYAHVLPRDIFERFYPRDTLLRLPLPTVAAASSSSSSRRPLQPATSQSSLVPHQLPRLEIEARQQVVVDVMETLFHDVLASDAVQRAVDDQQLQLQQRRGNSTPAYEPIIYRHARQSEDCAAIVATVMENTVFNILQELFHGDLDEELSCVPRKAVFPKASSPRKAAAAAVH